VKAEITRVFAGIHLEQLGGAPDEAVPGQVQNRPSKYDGKDSVSPGAVSVSVDGKAGEKSASGAVSQGQAVDYDDLDDPEAKGALGAGGAVREEGSAAERSRICHAIVRYTQPLTEAWGVHIINFQLESTRIHDEGYRTQYENFSLQMAKTKADRRVVTAQNQINVSKTRANAYTTKLQNESEAMNRKIQAIAAAERVKIDAEAEAANRQIQSKAAASRMKIDADAASEKLSIEARAEAQQLRTRAEAQQANALLIAETDAKSVKLAAEAKSQAIVLEAEATAKRIVLEATARNEAGSKSTNEFSKQLQISTLQNEMVAKMFPNVHTLVTAPDSALGRLVSAPALLPALMPGMRGQS